MKEQTQNAIIRSTRIEIEDHGILTAWLMLDYGGSSQGFGGYALDAYDEKTKQRIGHPFCSDFILGCLTVGDVYEWDSLKGKCVRAIIRNGAVHSIGHITKDIWFTPSIVAQRYKV